jgi:hypothetical protein
LDILVRVRPQQVAQQSCTTVTVQSILNLRRMKQVRLGKKYLFRFLGLTLTRGLPVYPPLPTVLLFEAVYTVYWTIYSLLGEIWIKRKDFRKMVINR